MGSVYRILNRIALTQADRIVVNAGYLIEFVKKFFYQNTEKIDVIHNAIQLDEHSPTKEYDKDESIHIGIIGKDTRDKNIPLFINVSLTLLQSDCNVVLHLCGRDLGDSNNYLDQIPPSMINRFHFEGELNNVTPFLKRLDIYLSTSVSEGLPNAIMEAMVYGLPVVATDVGGVRELVRHNDTGYVGPSNDHDALVSYCKKLIQNKQLRLEMGERGRLHIQTGFSESKMLNDFEKVFDQCLKMNPIY